MTRRKKTYTIFQLASAVFMMAALLWLTISLPFVFASQQQMAKEHKTASTTTAIGGNEEEAANPFGNTTEEKSPNASSFSEEYLHSHHIDDYFFSIALQFHSCEDADIYIAFHGELVVPPPDAA